MGLLDGKVAVITGAGSGMAKASVKIFVREGAQVVAGDISGAEQDTAAEVGENVLPVHCDVTDEADIEAMVRTAVEAHGRLDVMLNVAGIAEGVGVTDLTTEHYERTMDVDLRGVLFGMKHGIRAMLAAGNGGAIVNWSSVGGLGGSPFTSVYNAAKHGVVGATKCAAVEYGAQGIRVNALCPGWTRTDMTAFAADTEPLSDWLTSHVPLGRWATADEVVGATLFLASPASSFVTGHALVVDGGLAVPDGGLAGYPKPPSPFAAA